MTKDRPTSGKPAPAKANQANDNRVAQRHHKQSQGAQLSPANVEESPRMDRDDSAGGTGEALGHGREGGAKPPQRGALDTQYGTRSSMKTGEPTPAPAGTDAGSEASKGGDRPQTAPNPGSSEDSSGAERDTMTGPRPGSDS